MTKFGKNAAQMKCATKNGLKIKKLFQKNQNASARRISTPEKYKIGIEKPCNKLKNVTSKLKMLKSKLENLK